MYNPFSLTGKTILITGASSGIGRATAIECSKMGATVVVTGRNEERLHDTFDNLHDKGHKLIMCNITDNEQLESLIASTPKLDAVIHCAGVSVMKPLTFASRANIDNTFSINFYAPVELTRLLIKEKKISNGGAIVFISSVSGSCITNVGFGIYTASKSALNGIAKAFALELAPKKIRVNSISPGSVATDMLGDSGMNQSQIEQDITNYPLGRYGTPIEIAHAAIYLVSDAAQWTTGANMVIDGGYTLK